MDGAEKVVLDREAVWRAIARMAHEIVERAGRRRDAELALVGIQRRGVHLAHRLHTQVTQLLDTPVALGSLDISFHRDDLGRRAAAVVHASAIDFPLDGATVVIVDDVLFTGRTVRAAIEALFEYGRPARVQLAVLVDRGHRELPIRPDYVGKNLPTSLDERVNVRVAELDGDDSVTIGVAPGPRIPA